MYKYIIYILLTGLMCSCSAEFQTYDLSEEYAATIHYDAMSAEDQPVEDDSKSELSGIPARTFYNGDLMRGAIWYGGKGLTLEKGDVFIVEVLNGTQDSISFGATFPPLDLVGEPVVLKVSVLAKGNEGAIPTLYLEPADASGYIANSNRPFQKIENSDGFQDYYFNLKDIYMQNAPNKHKVNGTLINSFRFYINLGTPGFTGRIVIQEIRVVPASEVK